MIKYKLIVKDNRNRTHTYYPTRKTQIGRKSVLSNMKSAYLWIQYRRGYINEGDFTDRKTLLQFLNACTEQDLLNYMEV